MARKTKPEPKDNDFTIDAFNLDQEWIGQPDLYRRYAEALADAKQEYDHFRIEANLHRAEVELEIRSDPAEFGIEKVTEGTVKAVLESNDGVVSNDRKVVDAKHKVAVLEAAVQALDHRKRALSDLVSLHLSDYYSKPTAREEDKPAMDEVVKRKTRKGHKRRSTSDD
jgi:hypothetical protein